MPDDLRAQIDKALDDNPRLIGSTLDAARKEIIKTVLPVVEQAIQQEREKRVTTAAECLQRLAEKDAALAAIEAGLRAEFANGGTYEGHDVVSAFGEFIEHHAKNERALAEKDAHNEGAALALMVILGPLAADAAIVDARYGWNEVIAMAQAVKRRFEETRQQVSEILEGINRAADECQQRLTERDAHIAALRELESAVLYAMKCGCFFPVPQPKAGEATTEGLIQWGAMRHFHDAVARLRETPAPPEPKETP